MTICCLSHASAMKACHTALVYMGTAVMVQQQEAFRQVIPRLPYAITERLLHPKYAARLQTRAPLSRGP